MKRVFLSILFIGWASGVLAQSISASTQVSTGATKVTVNAPPNDVQAGPQNFTGAGNLSVSSQGSGSTGLVVSGTFTGAAWTVQGSVDSTNGTNGTWANIPFWDNTNSGTIYTAQPTATATSTYVLGSAGYAYVRIHVTAVSTGTLTATLNASAGSIQPAVGVQGTSTNITGLNGATSVGSKTSANSFPVVIASDQTAADPCMFQAKTNAAFSSASGTFSIVTGVSAKRIYICSLSIVSPTAVSISLAEGSSSTCGTSAQAAVIGVATNGTAANGLAVAANGGLTLGNGGGTVAATATNANYLCVFQSGTAQIAGNLTYVQQ